MLRAHHLQAYMSTQRGTAEIEAGDLCNKPFLRSNPVVAGDRRGRVPDAFVLDKARLAHKAAILRIRHQLFPGFGGCSTFPLPTPRFSVSL
jgi:hypothetical protein